MSKSIPSDHLETQLVHLGNDPQKQYGFISPPIYRGSTAVYEDLKTLKESFDDPYKKSLPNYGRFVTPNSRAFEEAMSELEGGHDAVTTNSGLSAITTAIMALVKTGDHLLIADSVYWPTRDFCNSLRRFQIEVDYYNPRIGSGIQTLFRPNTRLVYLESPGSLTFEIQDLPAITKACQQQKILTLIDNTWATPVFLQPLKLGVDISIHSCTKYIAGHSDSFMGVIICNSETYPMIRTQALQLGQCPSPEDTFLALRGLRTLAVRLQAHQNQALLFAQWLEEREEVAEVLYPALSSHRDYHLWKRDFSGASGLLSFLLQPQYLTSSLEAMMNRLRLFQKGYSWGGFESLAILSDPSAYRQKNSWDPGRPLVRLHIGLENIEDLKKDLSQAFTLLK